ncbi:MAG: molybdate ABC transporter permease subunit [Actinobacteria bacterium]|nr:molybdate ABC transporter permease subunit [Actinomycetota bacterium]
MKRTSHVPWSLLVPGLIAVVFLLLPLAALVIKAPWSEMGAEIGSPEIIDALRVSLVTSIAAALTATALGVPLAYLLARTTFPGRRLVRGLALLPLLLPPVVGGLALLLAFGRRGIAGEWLLDAFGLSLPFSTAGVVVAQTFVAMPFLVLTAEGALNNLDRRYEEAAATMGASRLSVFGRVIVPMILPSLGAGMLLAWARALGEFGATITFAGNLPGVTTSMPVEVYIALQTRPETAIVLSLILLVVSLAILVGMRGDWLQRT